MNRSKISVLLRATALTLASGLGTAAWAADNVNDLRAGQWAQWLYSIPASVNPIADATGQNCMVGQSGSVWYLTPGSGGGTGSRICTVPQGVKLEIMVAGNTYVYTPGYCGDVAGKTVRELRAAIAAFTDALTVNVTLDGAPAQATRIRSAAFPTALPADNLFTAFCGGPGSVPAGVYLSVDDAYYAEIENLSLGTHTLQLVATNGGSFNRNVVYTLTVVPRNPN